MKMHEKTLLCIAVVAVALNLVLPMVAKHFATDKQMNGGNNMNVWDEMMHMLVHHAATPVSSSVVVAAIVVLSVHFGGMLAHHL